MKRIKRANGRDYNIDFKTREDDGRLYIEGYFAVFNRRYDLWPEAFETIAPGAFDVSIRAGRDAVCLWNHDDNLALGRVSAGTLRLAPDEHGLYGAVEINRDDRAAMDAYARIKRGDVNKCSFGFDVIREEVIRHDNGETEFRLEELDLFEVSPCTFPAYEETVIAARKKNAEDANNRRRAAFFERIDKIAESLKA